MTTQDTVVGFIQTVLGNQWSYFWDETSSKVWKDTTTDTAITVSPTLFLGFAGGGIAFLLNLLGSLQNSSKLIEQVEASIDSWTSGYVDGNYLDILDDIKTSAKMQQLLLAFTIDLITFTFVSMMHSILLIVFGFIGSAWIFFRINTQLTSSWDTTIDVGFKALVMGTLLGSIGYFGGDITKNTLQSVMLSLGFLDHEGYVAGNETITQTEGANSISISGETEDISYDYKKFILIQDNW